MQPGQRFYDRIVEHFGPRVVRADERLDRRALADLAFAGGRIEELNRIVHPAVIRSQEEWMAEMGRQNPEAVAIVEAALILEAGAAKSFDRLIVVTCRDEQRIARFAARQKLDLAAARREVGRRMAAQLPEGDKIKAADFVIDNSSSLEQTREQVRGVWEKLRTFVDLPQK